ncbi:MAG: hypothetical protein HN368_11235, partial [Spirochaetales bacterium]|nr:hypothetical protein [Spirochaetales bacterium]
PFDFTATYLRIIDEEQHFVNLWNCKVAMSNDGSVLAGYAYDAVNYYAFTTDQLGANLEFWSMEAVTGSPDDVTVSGDGTHSYIASSHYDGSDTYPVLFKIVGSVFSQLNITEAIAEAFSDIWSMDCSGDGGTVFINNDGSRHVWTCNSSGTGLAELIDPGLFVGYDAAIGTEINEIAVDDTGTKVAFMMSRWSPFDDQDDAFAWDTTNGFQRLTVDDNPERGKSSLAISPNGTKILFRSTAPTDTDPSWYISELAGTPVAVPGVPLNGEGAGNGDMSVIFRANTTFSYSAGSLTTVATGETRQLFAGLGIDADGGLNINSTGDLIGFTHTYKSSPSVRALYTGLIGSMDGENGAPVIEWIRVTPPTISKADTEAELIVTVLVSDIGGLGDIDDIDRDILDNGDFFPSGEEPLSVSPLYDGGNAPDITAGDGIYTATCTATSDMLTFAGSTVTIRVAVEDLNGNAAVADVSVTVTP